MSLKSELEQDAVWCAKRLLGCEIIREYNNKQIVVKIIETEAYHERDAASHSYKGITKRSAPMFGPAGVAYVYFTYGMHYCFNVVTGKQHEGSAVLIRAVQPLNGIEQLRLNRTVTKDTNLTNGPAKLCQALLINKTHNKHNLAQEPLRLRLKPAIKGAEIVATARIGISHDTHRKWRFYIKDNPYISQK